MPQTSRTSSLPPLLALAVAVCLTAPACLTQEISGQPLPDSGLDGSSTTPGDAGTDAQAEASVPEAGSGEPPDASGMRDSGSDGSISPGCGECPDLTPACNPDTLDCQECFGADDLRCRNQGFVCRQGGATCIECNGDSDCSSGVCDQGSCAPCVADGDCGGEFCVDRQCRECKEDTDCATGVCVSNVCVQCAPETGRDTQCTGATSVCNPTLLICVGCLDNDDCGVEASACVMGTCEPCSEDADCAGRAETPVCVDGACRACDADAGRVALCDGQDLQCGAADTCVPCTTSAHCDGAASEPICDNEACRGCTDRAECEARDSGAGACRGDGACVQCTVEDAAACGDGVCNPMSNTCVECNGDADCTDLGSARCVENTCEPCDPALDRTEAGANQGTNPACDGLMDGARAAGVCAAGMCVQCTLGKTQPCGGDICASRDDATLAVTANTCVDGVSTASAAICQSCLSDEHCGVDSLCMPTEFESADNVMVEVGYFCLGKRLDDSCTLDRRPYVRTIADVASVDGVVESVCTLRTSTCPALNQFSDTDRRCTGTADHETCGTEGLDDGYCLPFPGETFSACTVPCLSGDDCKGGAACENEASLGRDVCQFD